jgi:hypothetical protein
MSTSLMLHYLQQCKPPVIPVLQEVRVSVRLFGSYRISSYFSGKSRLPDLLGQESHDRHNELIGHV